MNDVKSINDVRSLSTKEKILPCRKMTEDIYLLSLLLTQWKGGDYVKDLKRGLYYCSLMTGL